MNVFLIYFSLFIMLSASAQEADTSHVKLWIRCGADAVTTDEIHVFHALHGADNVTDIKDKLLNGNETEQVLSAIWLHSNSTTNSLSLTPEQRRVFNKIKRSQSAYELCSGCTLVEKGRVSGLFKRKRGASLLLIMQALATENLN